MRRENKQILKGSLIGASITTAIDIFLQWEEHSKRGEAFTWKNFDGWRTLKWAATGGAIGGGIGYLMHHMNLAKESKQPFSSDKFLNEILANENLKTDKALFNRIIIEREKVKRILMNCFSHKLVTSPEVTGSFHKRTAIRSNYDLDIIVPFKKRSVRSLERMFNDVYDVLRITYGSNASINKQRRAIGIEINFGNDSIHIDVVPGREINNYLMDRKLNLYVKPEWIWQTGSSFKTNVKTQKELTVYKPDARKAIKLVKSYRDKNELELPSVVIEQCVVDALSENNFGTSSSSTENLLNSMDYISERIESGTIIDKSNSNNNILENVSDTGKLEVSNQINTDLVRINEDPRFIKEIFE